MGKHTVDKILLSHVCLQMSTGCDHLLPSFCDSPLLWSNIAGKTVNSYRLKGRWGFVLNHDWNKMGYWSKISFKGQQRSWRAYHRFIALGRSIDTRIKDFLSRPSSRGVCVPWLKWHLEEWTSPHLVTRLQPPKLPIWQSTEWREASVLLEELLYRKFDN